VSQRDRATPIYFYLSTPLSSFGEYRSLSRIFVEIFANCVASRGPSATYESLVLTPLLLFALFRCLVLPVVNVHAFIRAQFELNLWHWHHSRQLRLTWSTHILNMTCMSIGIITIFITGPSTHSVIGVILGERGFRTPPLIFGVGERTLHFISTPVRNFAWSPSLFRPNTTA